MLTFFQVERHYCGINAKLTVDPKADAVALLVTWQGRIVLMDEFKVRDARGEFWSPEKCESWLSQAVPVSADGTLSRVEAWHWRASRGLLNGTGETSKSAGAL